MSHVISVSSWCHPSSWQFFLNNMSSLSWRNSIIKAQNQLNWELSEAVLVEVPEVVQVFGLVGVFIMMEIKYWSCSVTFSDHKIRSSASTKYTRKMCYNNTQNIRASMMLSNQYSGKSSIQILKTACSRNIKVPRCTNMGTRAIGFEWTVWLTFATMCQLKELLRPNVGGGNSNGRPSKRYSNTSKEHYPSSSVAMSILWLLSKRIL